MNQSASFLVTQSVNQPAVNQSSNMKQAASKGGSTCVVHEENGREVAIRGGDVSEDQTGSGCVQVSQGTEVHQVHPYLHREPTTSQYSSMPHTPPGDKNRTEKQRQPCLLETATDI